MSQNKSAWYHSNGYNAQSACKHCEGIISHERWCPTLNPLVSYAGKLVVSPDALTIGDAIILHSLGVQWGPSHAASAASPHRAKDTVCGLKSDDCSRLGPQLWYP